MSKSIFAMQAALVAHWDNLRDTIRRVNSGIQFLPSEGFTLFQPNFAESTREIASFTVGPLVVNLPERGNHHTANLFVVAVCSLNFNLFAFNQDRRLVSSGFASHVGYFRRGNTHLQHVYGVHYDFDTQRPAHPVFHAQLKSFATQFEPHVREQFNITLEGDDLVKNMLQNVRLPSAQLDFFSLIVQLVADHLMWEKSGPDERSAFNEILKLDGGIVGTSKACAELCAGAAIPCHRGTHWYERFEVG
jgi:hypothetical protein